MKKNLHLKKLYNWESLAKNQTNFSKSTNWIKFEFLLKLMKINGIRSRIFKSLFSGKFFFEKNFKFPPLEKNEIDIKVKTTVCVRY